MMVTFKKIVGSFLLPPGIIILLLLMVGMVLACGRRWRIGLINLSLGLALWAFSTVPMANVLMQGLESDFPIPAHPSGDVIILLGVGIIDQVSDLTGTAAPSPLMMGRIVTAVRLHKQLGLPIIVSGGGMIDDGAVAEASVVKRFLVDLGVPEQVIIEEDRARDTAQNARLTAAICRQQGFSRPILLTAAYHLKRARKAFDATGMKVTAFPAYFLGSVNLPYTWRHLLPRAGALYTCANALHEYLGLFYYRLVEP